jgi:hypothetical protein
MFKRTFLDVDDRIVVRSPVGDFVIWIHPDRIVADFLQSDAVINVEVRTENTIVKVIERHG